MKHRTGFVSNSSSCSFCIVGAYLEKLTEEQLAAIEKSGLYSSSGPHDDWGSEINRFVGLNIESMPDAMTLGAYKQQAAAMIEATLGQKVTPSIHQMGWYDG